MGKRDLNQQESLNHAIGLEGFDRLVVDTYEDVRYWKIKAMNGTVVFGPGCVVESGSAPAEDDVIKEGDYVEAIFTTLVIKATSTGVAYAYILSK